MVKTNISWADFVWNPILGCAPVSPACANCYAQEMAGRLVKIALSQGRRTPYETVVTPGKTHAVWTGEIARAGQAARFAPLKWHRPREIFTGSMTDFFHAGAPDDWRIEALAVMALTPRHKYLLLTKRAAAMRDFLTAPATEKAVWRTAAAIAIERDIRPAKLEQIAPGGWPLPNVALGVTAEDQKRADKRIPDLLETPAAKRFVSCEPLLGEIRFNSISAIDADGEEIWIDALTGEIMSARTGCQIGEGAALDQIIAGGESGANARPSHPDWFRSLRDQCAAAGVPFHFKQWGEWASTSEIAGEGAHFHFEDGATVRRVGTRRAGHLLDGVEHRARLPWGTP